MEIGRKFNILSFDEYIFYLDNYKKFSDFNTLGLYRSLSENEKISLNEKIFIRDYANKIFEKTFNFLQIKDPWTYIKVLTLGLELTNGDKDELWRKIFVNQKKILAEKKIRHANFGEYSKHNCGYETRSMNGIMIRQGSFFAEFNMCIGYTNRYTRAMKSENRKLDRKNEKRIIDKELDIE